MRAGSTARSNRASASGGGGSNTNLASYGRGPGQSNPGAKELDRGRYRVAFGDTSARSGGYGGELGDRAQGSYRFVSSDEQNA